MQSVFKRPVGADRREQAVRIGRQAADVEALFDRCFATDAAFGLNHGKGLQIRPLLGFGRKRPGNAVLQLQKRLAGSWRDDLLCHSPRQQFGDLIDRMLSDAGDDEAQISFWI